MGQFRRKASTEAHGHLMLSAACLTKTSSSSSQVSPSCISSLGFHHSGRVTKIVRVQEGSQLICYLTSPEVNSLETFYSELSVAFSDNSGMTHVDLGLSSYERRGNSDSGILVQWKVGLVIHGVKQPGVHDEAHDVAGKLAGSTGPRDNTNCDGHFFGAN